MGLVCNAEHHTPQPTHKHDHLCKPGGSWSTISTGLRIIPGLSHIWQPCKDDMQHTLPGTVHNHTNNLNWYKWTMLECNWPPNKPATAEPCHMPSVGLHEPWICSGACALQWVLQSWAWYTMLSIRSYNQPISMITCANLEEVAAPSEMSSSWFLAWSTMSNKTQADLIHCAHD